ncbi:sensor histidine kinase [Halothiobacillus sp. DCM-1]|uniref:sensor histidine kinase n=1 Tax=Halothiobacillus sp. DCM-1 TaxID=3112558 RepID=UPI00324D4CF4
MKAAAFPQDHENWRGIRLVNAYRVFLAFALVAAAITGRGPQVFGHTDSYLFAFTAWGYLILAMAFEFLLELRAVPYRPQAHLHALGDLLILTLIIHSSGGAGGGIALLMIIAVGLTAVLLGATAAMGYAALATLLVLGETSWTTFFDGQERQFAAAGFLGFALFVVALLVATFEQRMRRIERLTARREREVSYLSSLAVQVIEQAPNGILVSAPDGQVEYINTAARQLLAARRRADAPEANGQAGAVALALSAVHPGLANALQNWYDNTGEHPDIAEFNEPHRFRAEFHRLDTVLGQRALVVLIDLSSEDARLQQTKLASLGRLTASIAHEVRNPLSSIRQATELLTDATDEAERRELIPIILRHSARINSLIEGILDVARRPQVQPVRIDLSQWLKEFSELHRLDWEASGVTFNGPTLSPNEAVIRFDVSHLWQIMDNLAANAKRHGKSADGRTHIQLSIHPQDTAWLTLHFCDAGAGLAPAAMQTLFEPFFTTHADGVGLGLYISHELALANGAQLFAEPAPAAGSGVCFVLRAPRMA